MKNYDPSKFTYGYELEWGDIPRDFQIPDHLGAWEYSETDVLNLHGEYALQAADPQGISPPFGGEINTKPTATWQEQVDRIMQIYDLFVESGYTPTASLISHGHLHVHVPGLTQDIDALKRLTRYVSENQAQTVEAVHAYYDDPDMKNAKKGAKMYLKYDGGRQIPEYIVNNICNLATDFPSFIKMHAAGKDGVSIGRPFRYAINMYSLKHTQTVEFRCFRATTKREEFESEFKFVSAFMDAALNGGPPVKEILEQGEFTFPTYTWNREHWDAHVATKWDKSRGKKVRNFLEVK